MSHYVRFIMASGDHPRTKFMCTADGYAACRTVCRLCIEEEGRDYCECDILEIEDDDGNVIAEGREPVLEHGQDCNILNWLNEEPDECYDGEERPVKGPEWALIVPTWDGDCFVWRYDDTPVRSCSYCDGTGVVPGSEGQTWVQGRGWGEWSDT